MANTRSPEIQASITAWEAWGDALDRGDEAAVREHGDEIDRAAPGLEQYAQRCGWGTADDTTDEKGER